jgi:plasmid stabilization system protein ParE
VLPRRIGLRLHAEVQDDLDEIHDCTGRFDSSVTDRMLDEFLAASDLLPVFPHDGHSRSNLSSQPLRFKVV